MNEFNRIYERRVEQITRQLLATHRHLLDNPDENCFSIISENDQGNAGKPALSTAKTKRIVVNASASGQQGVFGAISNDQNSDDDGEDESAGRRKEDKFVQFAFMPKWFFMDLPYNILSPDDAERLKKAKAGFFFPEENPSFAERLVCGVDCHPLVKVYMYGSERNAAEDTAFVFFHLWHFPVDWKFYLKSFQNRGETFHDNTPLA